MSQSREELNEWSGSENDEQAGMTDRGRSR